MTPELDEKSTISRGAGRLPVQGQERCVLYGQGPQSAQPRAQLLQESISDTRFFISRCRRSSATSRRWWSAARKKPRCSRHAIKQHRPKYNGKCATTGVTSRCGSTQGRGRGSSGATAQARGALSSAPITRRPRRGRPCAWPTGTSAPHLHRHRLREQDAPVPSLSDQALLGPCVFDVDRPRYGEQIDDGAMFLDGATTS